MKGNIHDTSHVDARDGIIHYRIRQQDGTFQPMTCADTLSNRLFVSWVQIYDGYSGAGVTDTEKGKT